VVFPALLPLTYIPNLLSRTKALFLSLFEPYLRSLVDSLHGTLAASATALQDLRERIESERWERIFERCLRDCEGKDQSKRPGGGGSSLQRQAQLAAASGTANGNSHLRILTPPSSKHQLQLQRYTHICRRDRQECSSAQRSDEGKRQRNSFS
jgi:hypothetical protein